ncbi:hypothetical protein DFH07DRAFT_859731 [Mycena maculata]|uniref:F-box domain-containing protein n=1 Tax=Mycena maculata TaxID=230809 RepID=A0AAD7MJD7_9AGAR|nr:hypothetical protein DFH07DRAFT_859731 [Mycena maculata]
MERRPHLAQELTDHIIGFLRDSPSDWPACALVSRSWVYAAQAHIFRRMYFLSSDGATDERRWARFLEFSTKSPGLIRHVRQIGITIVGGRMSTETFLAICAFPFTRLDGVWLILMRPRPSEIPAAQQLLSRSTLRRVRLVCSEPSAFFQIWDRCSATVAHVNVYYSTYGTQSTERFSPSQPVAAPIRLESLDLSTVGECLRDWLMHPFCPLDFSCLKTVSIGSDIDILQSHKFTSARQTIETLYLEPSPLSPILDLSSFPALQVLRMHPGGAWRWVYVTLSTITVSSRIRKIIINDYLDITTHEVFDAQLSRLPISPIIEFEMHPPYYTSMISCLPLLRSKNTLRCAEEDPEWFSNLTGMPI